MQGYLTTHVLDTAQGCPAAEMTIRLYRLNGAERKLLCTVQTNQDGRTDQPILRNDQYEPGNYALEFDCGAYFDRCDIETPEPKFLDTVPIHFGMSDPDAHYHVPLLVSPYGYSTYRGS